MPADSLHKGLVRMAWGARNLYSLWRLTYNPPDHLAKNLSFKSTPMTLYQQKWVSKRMLRAYHGDWIQERRLRRRFMPDALPPLQANARGGGGGSTAEEASRNASTASNASDFGGRDATKDNRRIPLASLMWREVEARLDVLLFRACFTHSAYDARRMITQGHVKLNGKTCTDPNIILQPGDIFTVDPKEMYLLRTSDKPYQIQSKSSSSASGEEAVEEAEAAPAAESTSEVAAQNTEGATSEASPATSATEGTAEGTEPSIIAIPLVGEKAIAKPNKSTKSKKAARVKKEVPGLPFDLPDYSAPFLFIPAYLEVSFPTCSAIYVRHPTARPGYSEIPTPYDADGEVMRLGWEYYKGVGRRRRGVTDVGDEAPDAIAKELWTEEGKRNWTANWEDTQLEKRHMRAVRQGRGRWAHRPL